MARRLVDAKPLSEPMLEYFWLDPREHTSVKYWSKFEKKNYLQNGGRFVLASVC